MLPILQLNSDYLANDFEIIFHCFYFTPEGWLDCMIYKLQGVTMERIQKGIHTLTSSTYDFFIYCEIRIKS